MPQPRTRTRSRSHSRSSSASSRSRAWDRGRESSLASSTLPVPPAPRSIMLPKTFPGFPRKRFRNSVKNNEIQRDYMEYKMRTGSYTEKKEPKENEEEANNGSSSDEDFTERIRRFEKKQQEQKKVQPTIKPSPTKPIFQLPNTSSLTTSNSETPSRESSSNQSVWRSTGELPQNLTSNESIKFKLNPTQNSTSFVSSFISLHRQRCESSNSISDEPTELNEPISSSNIQCPSQLTVPQPTSSAVMPEVKLPMDDSQTKKICFTLNRTKPTLAYDPLEKSKEKDDNNKPEDSESEDSTSDEDHEESSVDDQVKISKTKPKLRFSLSQKVRDNCDNQLTLSKLYQRWFKFSWNNYDSGMIPVHLGRVPEEVLYNDFEKLQIRDEMRAIPPQIDLMRDYFMLMHDLADYYCSFAENFVPIEVEGGGCLRMKPSVKKSIPFIGFMKMLNNHSYTYDQLDQWLAKLGWRLLETNRFLESPVREPIHKPKTPQAIDNKVSIRQPSTINGNGNLHNNDILDMESEMDTDPIEDEPEISSVSDYFPEHDSMDDSLSADLQHEVPAPSSKGSDEDDSTPFVPLYEGLVEPKIYQIDDRLPPIPVLCSRDPKSSNPVSEEQFFLEKLYNQEYYYSTKEFRIDVVPPPARPLMFLLESLKARRLPNSKEVPVGQQVVFVLPRGHEDV